jgi:hypothetical protein
MKKLLAFAVFISAILTFFPISNVNAATTFTWTKWTWDAMDDGYFIGCESRRIPTNPWNGQQILPNSNQRYANLQSVNMSCADLSGIDFYGAVVGGVTWNGSNLNGTNWGGTQYNGQFFVCVTAANSNLTSSINWYNKNAGMITSTFAGYGKRAANYRTGDAAACSIPYVDVAVTTTTTTAAPTTTTTIAPTTTTTVAPTTTTTTVAPTTTTTTVPRTTTTTTVPRTTTTTTTTIPPTTTTSTTTTTIYNPRITYCQAMVSHYINSIPQWNYANWQQANEPLSTYTSNALVYPNSYRYPVPVNGCSSLNTIPTTTTTTTTIAAPVVQQQAPSKPIAPAAPAQPAKPQAPAAPVLPATPVPAQPAQPQAPTVTLPKVQAPAIPLKSQWAYVTKRILQTIPSNIKTGAICKNGSTANTTHPLTCLKQGGVKKWIYSPSKKIYVNKKHICYLNKSTNKYTKNCKLA